MEHAGRRHRKQASRRRTKRGVRTQEPNSPYRQIVLFEDGERIEEDQEFYIAMSQPSSIRRKEEDND